MPGDDKADARWDFAKCFYQHGYDEEPGINRLYDASAMDVTDITPRLVQKLQGNSTFIKDVRASQLGLLSRMLVCLASIASSGRESHLACHHPTLPSQTGAANLEFKSLREDSEMISFLF